MPLAGMVEQTLANGIVLRVVDKTVPLAGDLFMVRLEITFAAPLDETEAELRAFCGPHIVKTRVLERPAVHLRHLDEVRDTLRDSYLNTTIRYLEHPKFLGRLKEKTLQAHREKQEKHARMRAAGVEPE